MKKNAMKNFIFSFFVSLLAVVTVNKVVFHTPENPKTDKKISDIETKSISLFSQNKQPQKNIAKPIVFADIEKLTTNNNTDKNIAVKDDAIILPHKETPKIVYTFEATDVATNIKKEYNTDLATATEIILEKEVISTEEHQENAPVQTTNIAFADISDTLIDEEKLKEAEIVYKPEDSGETKNNTMQIAQNDVNISTETEEDIPLMQSTAVLHENIDILTSAQKSQIAMLEPNTLVSSIESFEETEETPIVEQNLKSADTTEEISATSELSDVPEENVAWKQMSEQDKAKDKKTEDNPWVVAKGNRFAKNKIAQFDALSEEDNNSEEKDNNKDKNDVAETASTENYQSGEEIKDTEEEQKNTEENQITVHQKTSEVEIKENIEFENVNSSESNIALTKTLSTPSIPVTIEIIKSQKVNEETGTDQLSLLEPKPLLIPSSEGTKLARQMMQNLIIPIPEDIMNDADTTPILSSAPNKKALPADKKIELSEDDKDSGLFKSITSWFSGDKKDDSKNENPKLNDEIKDKKKNKKKRRGFSLFDDDNSDNKKTQITKPNNTPTQIMPAELKLAFQHNRAEISGHTLKWIHAFADNARDNPEIYIEIRIDGTSSFSLQQKRLNLLSSIFANRGVDFRKVNIVFTSREPNSFIIRNIRFNNSEDIIADQDEDSTYYQQW